MEVLKPNPATAQISFFKAPVTNKVPSKNMVLPDIYSYIRGPIAKDRTAALRKTTDHNEARKLKASQFDYVMFSGYFTYGDDAHLVQHSGLLCLDFDHKDVVATKQLLLNDPHFETELLFTSPSGDGVKWVIPIDTSKHTHLNWFHAISRYLKDTYNLEADPACKNVSRACFLPHDPDAYINPKIMTAYTQKWDYCEMIKDFDVDEWLKKDNHETINVAGKQNNYSNYDSLATKEQIIEITNEIVSRGIDICGGYNDWFKIGFAIADGMGEEGREIFHRLSSINTAKYNYAQCDKQYTDCLHGKGSGIHVGTFFDYAKKAGVCATCAKVPSDTNKYKNTKNLNYSSIYSNSNDFVPVGTLAQVAQTCEKSSNGYTFSDKIDRADLDMIIGKVYDLHHEDTSKCDAQIITVLNAISGLLGGANGTAENRSGIYGVYDGRRVYADLFNIIYSSAGNGKGDLIFAKMLVNPVKSELRRKYEAEKADYDEAMALYEGKKKGDRGVAPEEPVFRDPFVPGNSSSSSVYRALDANGGWGLMFETEADTVSSMIDSDYGNYSDLMRKAHHHETLSMNRVTEKLHIDIDEPRLSILLTCTPGQMPSLFPSFENGLGSRFLFYHMPDEDADFHDVFAMKDSPLEDTYKELGDKLLPLYHALVLRKGHPIQFVMSQSQQKTFISTYQDILQEQFKMLGKGIRAFIFRIALECFRYAMILTTLRKYSEWYEEFSMTDGHDVFNENENALVCDDRDFKLAMTIIDCLINHTARVYAVLAKEGEDPFTKLGIKPTPNEQKVYNAIPQGEFHTSDFITLCAQMDIPYRSAHRILSKLCNVYGIILPVRHGVYCKPSTNNSNK